MKSGAGAGGVAGFIAAIVSIIIGFAGYYAGMWPESILGQTGYIVTMLILDTFWGIVLGFIFEKVYNLVPRSGVMKGFVYAMVIWFIANIQMGTFNLVTTPLMPIIVLIAYGFVVKAVFGVVLGVLYKK
jgi:hypothetical protein